MIERSIEGIFPELYDKIIFAILKDDSIKYNAKEIIENELADNYSIDICEFDKLTSGPAETVYKTIKEKIVKIRISIIFSKIKVIGRANGRKFYSRIRS